MQERAKKKLIKRTVVIHPLMDSYIRMTWSMLIEEGYDATYSSALNMMLLMATMEAIKEGGLTEETKDIIWKFAEDQKTITELNLEEHLTEIRRYFKLGGD